MAYNLEGRLLEVCTCKILCPCWVNEAPDYGTCQGVLAWHFEQGGTLANFDVEAARPRFQREFAAARGRAKPAAADTAA
jgi:hypothetical protein